MEQSVRSHIDWMLTREGSSGDIGLRDVLEFSSYTLMPPIPEPPTEVIDDFEFVIPDRTRITPINPPKVTEIEFAPDPLYKPIEINDFIQTPITDVFRVDIPNIIFIDNEPFPVTPLPLDIVGGSPISGEGSRANPQRGSSTSRGGVLGGGNYSNPRDAIDNEFRFRDRITEREL
jgi:hypothetical protein